VKEGGTGRGKEKVGSFPRKEKEKRGKRCEGVEEGISFGG